MNYKGDGLPALIHRHGDGHMMHVLYNSDDFRYVYVDDGDERPLVTLVNEHVRPETPAWSMNEAKERLTLQKSSIELALRPRSSRTHYMSRWSRTRWHPSAKTASMNATAKPPNGKSTRAP